MNSGFHLRDGLHFTRLENGAVRIDWLLGTGVDDPKKSVTVAENEWASAVASVSKEGDNHDQWMKARILHGLTIADMNQVECRP